MARTDVVRGRIVTGDGPVTVYRTDSGTLRAYARPNTALELVYAALDAHVLPGVRYGLAFPVLVQDGAAELFELRPWSENPDHRS
jgi:hypothetical protein